jgi:hypothetical protein
MYLHVGCRFFSFAFNFGIHLFVLDEKKQFFPLRENKSCRKSSSVLIIAFNIINRGVQTGGVSPGFGAKF